MLIIAEAMSESSLEYIGAPKPAGIPLALTSITAPHDEPDFLIPNKYFSHNLIIDLSGQKNGFLLIIFSSQFLVSQPKIPN